MEDHKIPACGTRLRFQDSSFKIQVLTSRTVKVKVIVIVKVKVNVNVKVAFGPLPSALAVRQAISVFSVFSVLFCNEKSASVREPSFRNERERR